MTGLQQMILDFVDALKAKAVPVRVTVKVVAK